jgi:hypothetical protein
MIIYCALYEEHMITFNLMKGKASFKLQKDRSTKINMVFR